AGAWRRISGGDGLRACLGRVDGCRFVPQRVVAMLGHRTRVSDVLIAGGTMLTGTTPEGAPIFAVNSQTMLWERTTGQVRPAESMPVGLYYHSAALLGDGRVLLAGGSDAVGMHTSADPVTRAEIYDPVARSWSAAASLPVARYQAIAVPLHDGRVFLVGGCGLWLGTVLASYGQPSLLFTPQP